MNSRLGSSLRISLTKWIIYDNKMVELSIFVFSFSKRPLMFHYYIMEMFWCLILLVFFIDWMLFFSHILINHEFLHNWSFSPHTWYVIFAFWLFSQRLCALAQVKQNVALAFSCIFLIVLLVMGLLYHFGLWCVHLFFHLIWFVPLFDLMFQ